MRLDKMKASVLRLAKLFNLYRNRRIHSRFSVVSPRNRHLLDAHDLHHLIQLHPLISAMMLIVDDHATDVNRKYIK